MTRPPNHPLRDVLGTPTRGLVWLTGVVTEVDTVRVPHTIRVRLADGTITEPITYMGWWSPLINDTAELIAQGSKLMALGAVAPSNLDLPNPPAPVIPATPPDAPTAPPVIRTVPVQPVDAAYWSQWGWRTDGLIQGGPANRAHWWYGTAVQAARAGGVIVGGSVYVERLNTAHGVNGAANVRVGVHTQAERPVSGESQLAEVAAVRTLARGKGTTVPLTAAQVAALNAGALGLGLEPGGSSYSSPDYLRATIGGASGALSLTVQTSPA